MNESKKSENLYESSNSILNSSFLNKFFDINLFLNQTQELYHIIFYSLIGFFTPFLLGHPQLLVGSIVNAMLILAAFNIKKDYYPLIFLPSLGVLTRGIIFGPFTYVLVYMLPGIWLGNFVLIETIKYMRFKHKKVNLLLKSLLAILLKVFVISTTALIIFKLGLMPKFMLVPFSLMQLITAINGLIIAFIINKTIKHLYNI